MWYTQHHTDKSMNTSRFKKADMSENGTTHSIFRPTVICLLHKNLFILKHELVKGMGFTISFRPWMPKRSRMTSQALLWVEPSEARKVPAVGLSHRWKLRFLLLLRWMNAPVKKRLGLVIDLICARWHICLMTEWFIMFQTTRYYVINVISGYIYIILFMIYSWML